MPSYISKKMLRMLVAKPRRNQHLDRVAQQLGSIITQKLFRLRIFFFFNDTATTEIYPLSLHDALPIYFSFSPFAFADIADRTGDERAPLGFERAQADLDGKFAAVLIARANV